jgi:hypothetical protein
MSDLRWLDFTVALAAGIAIGLLLSELKEKEVVPDVARARDSDDLPG